MSDRLDGITVLVTGASSGIGAATARALAARGAAVAMVARRSDRLATVAAEIEGAGGVALAMDADISDRMSAKAVVESVLTEMGRLDMVVNNAGVMLLGPLLDAPTEEWDRMIAVNLQGLLHITHAALPHLLQAAQQPPRRVADLVNVSSVAGRLARAGSGIYNLTKHGVGAVSESLRQELAARHVRVSLMEPGFVRTELLDHMREDMRAQTIERIGGIERLHAEDIAEAIVYVVTRPRHVAINEMLVRPTEQVA